MNILKLDKKDYEDIISVWEASALASHNFLSKDEIEFYKPLILKYALPQNQNYGLKENNQLVGFIGIREHKVEMLFIHPDFFGKKFGSQLLDFAIKEHDCNLIDVNEENPRALKFYQDRGFKVFKRDELDDCGKPHPILHLQR